MTANFQAMVDFPGPDGEPLRRRFTGLEEIFVATHPSEVRPALRAVERAVDQGFYAVGFLSYEAAPAFDPAMQVRGGGRMPLLCFGLFRGWEPQPPLGGGATRGYSLGPWEPTVSEADYRASIHAIHAAIARGESYQVNYTLRLRSRFDGDDRALYDCLHRAQRPRYGALLRVGRFRLLSASPELFFERQGSHIWARPMKGTAPRGRWPAEDEAQASALALSEKNRAENVMIVDLLRNDLGRIAQAGSVQVPQLFTLERYPTVWQMTSTVAATLPPETTLESAMVALFPCGSITGAPKIRTMGLIAALETTPREIYCGTIGVVEPGGRWQFNVAIRTLWLDVERGTAEYGTGGGITWDSTAEGEFAEAQLKAALLTMEQPSFELLETVRLEGGALWLRERHLARLFESARYFDIPIAQEALAARLDAAAAAHPQGLWRVRLLVSQGGDARTEVTPLPPLPAGPLRVALARTPVASADRWLFHKSTHRALYERHRAEQPDVFDVLLWNERGELTEFCIGTLVAELDGQRWTPPLHSGLLPGTLRAELLARGEIQERPLPRAALSEATRLWLVNSLRGWTEVQLEG